MHELHTENTSCTGAESSFIFGRASAVLAGQFPNPAGQWPIRPAVGVDKVLGEVARDCPGVPGREIGAEPLDQLQESAHGRPAAWIRARGEPSLDASTGREARGSASHEVTEPIGADADLAGSLPQRHASQLAFYGVSQ